MDFSNAPYRSADHSYFRLPESLLPRLYGSPRELLERYFSWKVHPYLVNVCMANENFYRNGYLVADKAGAAKAGERFGALLARTAALVPGRMVLFTIPGCAEFF